MLRARLFFALGLLSTALLFMGSGVTPAAAQNAVVVVNGDPITTWDIEQRTKFTQLTTKKVPARQEVVEELINEKIKVQAGVRFRLDIGDKDIESSYSDMARRMRMSSQQLTALLAQSGVAPDTLKSRIRADLSWQQIIRGKFQSNFQIRDKDVLAAAEAKRKSDQPIVDKIDDTEYVLRPILFVVPKGAQAGTIESRKRDAELLRGRFSDCEHGLALARSIRDVAVREQIVKNASDLAPALREILDKSGVGHLTPPETTSNGIEMFAVCTKRDVKVDAPALKEARQEIFLERFNKQSARFLRELRRSAMIEMK